MIFAWDGNREHLAKHDVSPAEAEEIVRNAMPPYPADIGDEKILVWGQTAAGRYLQVIFVRKTPQELEFESLAVEEWMDVEDGDVKIARIIHAMDLTPSQKTQFRRRRS